VRLWGGLTGYSLAAISALDSPRASAVPAQEWRTVMIGWHVSITLANDPGEAVRVALATDLEPLDGSASAAPRGHWTVSGWHDADDPEKAQHSILVRARRVLRRRGIQAPIVAVETVSENELDARHASPNYPELVSAAEAAEILGVSRQRVHQLAVEHSAFPPTLYELGAGKLWTAAAIRGFARQWSRKPGRPAKRTG